MEIPLFHSIFLARTSQVGVLFYCYHIVRQGEQDMYNPNPYYAAFNPYAMAQHNPTPTLQPQQIIQVNGKASVDTIQLAPNSSLLAMDTTAPIVWMCVSDGVGKVSATAYDITVHKDKPPIDVEDIEQRISRVEKIVAEWKESINDKSNGDSFNAKQNSAKCSTSQTAHADH